MARPLFNDSIVKLEEALKNAGPTALSQKSWPKNSLSGQPIEQKGRSVVTETLKGSTLNTQTVQPEQQGPTSPTPLEFPYQV